MPNTYTQLYIHIVFAVQGRASVIHEPIREQVEKYITGIIKNKQQKLFAIYCMPNHLHMLVSIKPDLPVSDLVRIVKSETTKFINDNKLVVGKFSWQEGFGAFSYAQSQIDIVCKYILNQSEHHKRKSFKEEYIELLQRFDVEYNDAYLFEFLQGE